MSQHGGQTASNMLCPTMLRYVAFCNRLVGALHSNFIKPKLFLRPLFLPHFNKASTIPGRKVGYSSNFLVECATRTLKPVPYIKPKFTLEPKLVPGSTILLQLARNGFHLRKQSRRATDLPMLIQKKLAPWNQNTQCQARTKNIQTELVNIHTLLNENGSYKGVTPGLQSYCKHVTSLNSWCLYCKVEHIFTGKQRQDIAWPTSSLSEDEDAALLAASIEARVVLFLESLSSHIENNCLNLKAE